MEKHRNQDVKRFIYILIPFLFALTAADYLVGNSLEFYYHKQTRGTLYRTSYAINEMSEDILVVGSSRANHHYDPQLLATKLGRSVYNSGRDGQGLLYSCAIISAAMSRYTPEIVVLDIAPDEFSQHEKEKLASLLPYRMNPEIKPFVAYMGNFEQVKLLSKTYPYNAILPSIIAGNTDFIQQKKDHFGFMPLAGTMVKGSIPKLRAEQEQDIDPDKIALFKTLLDKLEKRKVKTYLVISPMYNQYQEGYTVKTLQHMLQQYKHIRFLNFLNHQAYFNPELFRDPVHLNGAGAMKFSADISSKISAE